MIILIKPMKNKSKKQFQQGVRIDFSLRQGDSGHDIQGKRGRDTVYLSVVHPLTPALFPPVSLHCCSFSARPLQGAEERDQLKTAHTLKEHRRLCALVTACYLLIQQIIIEYQALGKEQERTQTQSHPHGVYRLAVRDTDTTHHCIHH